MAKIVVGLYDEIEHARMAVEELIQNGFRREDISMVASDARGEFKRTIGDADTGEDIGKGAASGAGIGAVLGGLGGLLVGLGALAIPGIGPVIAAGPLVSALAGAGIGAATGGLLGALVGAGIPEDQAEYYAEGVRRGGTLVTVQTSDEMAGRAVDILNRHNPVDVERRSAQWRESNWQGFDPNAQPYTAEEIDTYRSRFRQDVSTEGTTLPVVEEEIRVGKREVETGGVRVHTWVTEEPVEETLHLREERVDVERRPVDRPVSDRDLDAFKEGTMEISTSAEEAVVDKKARVVEEVEIRKEVEDRPETIRDTVRRTDVEVEDMTASGRTTDMSGFDEYDNNFRSHYTTNYGNTSYTYDQYRPYYQYGYQLASEARYRGRSWDQVEMEARREWERSHPDSLWDDFKEAVREGWNAVRGRR